MVSEVESKGLAKAQGVNRDPADSVPSPLHPGRSLREGRGRWRGSDWGRRGTRLPQRHPGGLGGCVLPGSADAGISGGGLGAGSEPGPAGINPQRGRRRLPIPRRRLRRDPSAASELAGWVVPLGYGPRLLAAAAEAALNASVCPQPMLSCQLLLLLLPPPPPPGPHRSHRRCGDYCSAR